MIELLSILSTYAILEMILSAVDVLFNWFTDIIAHSSVVERLIDFAFTVSLYFLRICIDTGQNCRCLVITSIFFVIAFFFWFFFRLSFTVWLFFCTFSDIIIKKKLIHCIFPSIWFKNGLIKGLTWKITAWMTTFTNIFFKW